MAEELLRHMYIPSARDSYHSRSKPNTASRAMPTSQNLSTTSNDPLRNVLISQNASPLSPYTLAGLAATDPHEVTGLQYTMASDLRDQTVIPSHEDSYYSANSSPAVRPVEPSQQPPSNSQPLSVPPNLIDVNSYLQQNPHPMAETDGKGKGKSAGVDQRNAGTSTDANDDGPSSNMPKGISHPVASTGIFVHTCQTRGIQPVWDIKEAPVKVLGAPRFIGTVTMGDQVVTVNEVQSSKKDVRMLLAERALPVVETMETPTKKAKRTEDEKGEDINWIGKLLEWNNSLPINLRLLDYTEYPPVASTPNFSATVTITVPATPNPLTKTFGSPQDRYQNKKIARIVASKAAVEYLIRNGQLAADGSVIKKPKGLAMHSSAPKPGISTGQPGQGRPTAAAASSSSGPSTEAATFSRRVPAMSQRLGFPPPVYNITPTNPEITGSAFYDCTAIFPPSTGLPNPVASVRNVFGKKNVKEDCAREVCAVLEAITEKRLKEAGLLPEKGGGNGRQPAASQTQKEKTAHGLDGNVDTDMADA